MRKQLISFSQVIKFL